MEPTKVLIISYYWPPSGGAGVQRWVKLTKYLGQFNIECHVLTVDENFASYMQLDPSLEKEVSSEVKVYKTKANDPIKRYAKIVGKDKVPTAGFANTDVTKFSSKVVNFLRSNLFIPDPRKGWNKFALKKAKEIINKEQISTIITTSPPHSTQLIGLELKKSLGVNWIADLRDPWTDIYYYKHLGHTKFSAARDKAYEKAVIQNADKIITVGQGLKELFSSKDKDVSSNIEVISNGFDPEDFRELQKQSNDCFTITYTGTISDQYQTSGLIKALKRIKNESNDEIKLQIVGKATDHLIKRMESSGINFQFISTVPHSEINQYQKNADLLLVIIPDIEGNKGIITGKMFEYLATENPILCLGPEDSDAASILRECKLGSAIAPEKNDQILMFLKRQIEHFKEGRNESIDKEAIHRYSRKNQAEQVAKIIKHL